jgi:hypothetical protein
MSAHFGCYPHHSDSVVCPKCGQKGSILWEDVPRAGGDGKEMSRISGNFYERLSKKAPHPIELVCNGCGTSQTE